ncbi:MAG: GNAT family N-acetyltransferase, partial [Dehalococcoidia bacterium]
MIRAATPDDFDPILKLWSSIERHTALPDTIELLQQFHEFSPDLFLVAETDGRIVGTIIGGWDGWRGHIARLATDPSVRRQGLARKLVAEVECRLRERGVKRIYALADRRSELAIPFWEAAGYQSSDSIIQYSRNMEVMKKRRSE